jgi:acyl-CoA thioesterase II
VPDLLADTAVASTAKPGVYAASLSPDWAVWGPNGGYVAAMALRAAMDQSRLPRPASFQCHFLAVGEFAEVEIQVSRLGGGKRAESLRVDLRQGERLLLAATVWMVSEGLRGYEHEVVHPPGVPAPEVLKSFAELAGDEYADWYPIWRSIEGRPVTWREPPGDPDWHCWLRLTETPVADMQADAIRQLFWLDLPGWNATIAAHSWPFQFLAPNLDLMVQFHRFAHEEQWMLAHGNVPQAADGVLGCISRLWTKDGRLLATGASKHTCRPNPNYGEDLALAREQGLIPEAADSEPTEPR